MRVFRLEHFDTIVSFDASGNCNLKHHKDAETMECYVTVDFYARASLRYDNGIEELI